MGELDRAQSFEEWEAAIAGREALTAGALWNITAYRLSRYAIDVGWIDATRLQQNRLTRPLASQLYRALGSIAANLAEGFSRSGRLDRARLFEYALGSARECCVWYRTVSPALSPTIVESRLDVLTQISKLLVTTIKAERTKARMR